MSDLHDKVTTPRCRAEYRKHRCERADGHIGAHGAIGFSWGDGYSDGSSPPEPERHPEAYCASVWRTGGKQFACRLKKGHSGTHTDMVGSWTDEDVVAAAQQELPETCRSTWKSGDMIEYTCTLRHCHAGQHVGKYDTTWSEDHLCGHDAGYARCGLCAGHSGEHAGGGFVWVVHLRRQPSEAEDIMRSLRDALAGDRQRAIALQKMFVDTCGGTDTGMMSHKECGVAVDVNRRCNKPHGHAGIHRCTPHWFCTAVGGIGPAACVLVGGHCGSHRNSDGGVWSDGVSTEDDDYSFAEAVIKRAADEFMELRNRNQVSAFVAALKDVADPSGILRVMWHKESFRALFDAGAEYGRKNK